MIFGALPLAEAPGAVLAHSHRLPGRVLKKGLVLDAAACAALAEAGYAEVIAARLEEGDVAEDVAETDDTEDMPPEGDASTEAGNGT